jgi:hypothetical protein
MFDPGYTKQQGELLDMLAEEAGEIVQAVSKIKRHGASSYHPGDPTISNASMLTEEIRQLFVVYEKLVLSGIGYQLGLNTPRQSEEIWKGKLKYTHFQEK